MWRDGSKRYDIQDVGIGCCSTEWRAAGTLQYAFLPETGAVVIKPDR